jgi:hypothetical protein
VDGQPFFRGQNRFDWLVGVTIQFAADWGSTNNVSDVCAVIGDSEVMRFADPSGVFPNTTVAITDDYVFICFGSTHNTIQWIGNVLGSAATTVQPAHGSVSQFFGAYAQYAYLATRQIVANRGSRQVVLLGFSLGGAAALIVKDMLLLGDSVPSAAVVYGNPRPGTTSFASGYATDNVSGFGVINDVVPSFPPSLWAGTGLHNSWTPFPPFVTYTHVTGGSTLLLDGSITDGYSLQPVTDVILGFDTGIYARFHSQYLYARTLRRAELPNEIPDGFEGYAHAGIFDDRAQYLFSTNGEWPFPAPLPIVQRSNTGMTLQITVGIRNLAGEIRAGDEIYYMDGSDPAQAILNTWIGGTNILGNRLNFLSKSCCCYYIRANLVGTPRKSYLKRFNPVKVGTFNSVTETFDDCLAYFGYNADRSSKRQFHFRGIPSSWITADGLTGTGDKFSYLIDSDGTGGSAGTIGFLQKYANNSGVILKDPTAISAGHMIQSAAKATQDSVIVLTVGDGYAPAPGTLIEITGCRQAPLLNAKWLTQGAAVAGQVTLQGSQRYSCPVNIGGTVRPVSKVSSALTNFELIGVSDRKSGRPRFLRRGRQSAKLRRR